MMRWELPPFTSPFTRIPISKFIIQHLILTPLSLLSPSRRRLVPVSDDEEGAGLITSGGADAEATSPVLEMASLGPAERSGDA